MPVAIPTGGRVLTLTGAWARPLKHSWWRGELWRSNEREDIDYPNAPTAGNATTAVNMLNTRLVTLAPLGLVIVAGHSMGAQIIYKWLREFGPTATGVVPPENVLFVSSANPERKWTGVCHIHPTIFPAAYGGIGFPESTPYTVVDIVRQYDYWADHPLANANRHAELNIGDIFCPFHGDYTNVGFNDEKNIEHVEGNALYITNPSYPLKLLRFSGWRGAEYVMRRDQELRPMVEAGYGRPKAVPMPDYWGKQRPPQQRTPTCSPNRNSFWSGIK